MTVSSATMSKSRAHAVARDHRAGELGRLLDVVGSAGGDRAEADLLGGAAAGERRDLVLHFLACHQVMVALLDLHRVAQRARGAGIMVIFCTGAEWLCSAATSAWPVSW